MLNLINLIGETSNNWRDDNADYVEPIEQDNGGPRPGEKT
jgi:hypothetical protein